jgi:hypothetical protein
VRVNAASEQPPSRKVRVKRRLPSSTSGGSLPSLLAGSRIADHDDMLKEMADSIGANLRKEITESVQADLRRELELRVHSEVYRATASLRAEFRNMQTALKKPNAASGDDKAV